MPKKEKTAYKKCPFLYKQKEPCLKRPLNWTGSVFPVLILVATTIHFSPLTGEFFTDFLFMGLLSATRRLLLSIHTFTWAWQRRMLHSFTPFTRIHSLHPREYLGNVRNTVSGVLFRKRELTEFCGKRGELCGKNSVSLLRCTNTRLRGTHWVLSRNSVRARKTHWVQCLKSRTSSCPFS